jgi:hypothetical protein
MDNNAQLSKEGVNSIQKGFRRSTPGFVFSSKAGAYPKSDVE